MRLNGNSEQAHQNEINRKGEDIGQHTVIAKADNFDYEILEGSIYDVWEENDESYYIENNEREFVWVPKELFKS